jgi:hypothetical protein
MVKFTNYSNTSSNIVKTLKSSSPIEAGLFVYQNGSNLAIANDTTENVIGVVLGESSKLDNRTGLHHSVAIHSAGVLVQREALDTFQAGDIIYVSANGKASSTGTVRVALATESSTVIDGVPVVLMSAL